METKMMDVEVKRVFKLQDSEFLKAFVDIAVNDAILIKGLKVLNGKDGLYVSMPQEKAKDQKWYDTVKALNDQAKGLIDEQVLEAYRAQEFV